MMSMIEIDLKPTSRWTSSIGAMSPAGSEASAESIVFFELVIELLYDNNFFELFIEIKY
jgi:hypothetical protein